MTHLLTSCAQGDLHHFHDIHVDHRGRHGRDLFGSSPEWLNLRLECGERWAQVRSLLRIHRRLVVMHGMDDVRCRKLSRGSRLPSLIQTTALTHIPLPLRPRRTTSSQSFWSSRLTTLAGRAMILSNGALLCGPSPKAASSPEFS